MAPGLSNALSRGRIVPTEWSLLLAIAQLLFSRMDRPHVDLFATAANAQLPVYCTRYCEPWALHTEESHKIWKILAVEFTEKGIC